MNKQSLGKIILALSLFILVSGLSSPSTLAKRGSSVQLSVILIKTEPVPLQTGEYAEIWVKVKNKGDLEAENTTLKLIPEFPFKVDPDEDLSRNFGKVRPGEEYFAHFQVKIDENAVQGENEIKFKTSSKVGSVTRTVPVQIRTDDAALLVEEVSLGSGSSTIAPSKTEEVKITLKNLADSYLKNVDISLGLGSSTIPLITVGSTTSRRVQKIAPGKKASVSFKLKADSDAGQKAYKIPVKIQYENEVGTKFSKEEYTGIIVGGRPELETNVADIEGGYVKSGTTKEVSISLVNRGLSVAKFVSLEVLPGDGYRVISPSKIYIGNMESDDYESSNFDIYVEKGTERVALPLRLSYKDSEGNSVIENETVSFETYTGGEAGKFNLEKGNNQIYFVILIVVVLAVGYYWYRRRKSKESALLEEE